MPKTGVYHFFALPCFSHKKEIQIMDNETIDVAIVGGGVSGVYCAWRLKQANPAQNIVLFEASDHIGGRLLSLSPPGIPNMVAELGGMRVVSGAQPLIESLIDELNLQGADIELFDFPVDGPQQLQNIAYLRGIRLTLSDFTVTPPNNVPYQLSEEEQGKSAGEIIINAIEQIVPGITEEGLTDEERRDLVRTTDFDGLPLNQQGFWNVLLQVMSHEGYQLGVDAGGYNSTLLNWNAADAIPWYLSDFGTGVVYQGFKNGFQQVPILVKECFEEAGGDVRLKTRLEGFDWSDTDGMFQLEVKHRLQTQTINASQLILAMPRRSLDLLAPTSPPLQGRRIQRLISSVTPRPLFKLFTTYDNPWWISPEAGGAGVNSGRSVTDLPVRQTYYWPKEDGTAPENSEPAMLMASYDDGPNVGYWDGLRPRRGQAWLAGHEVAVPSTPFVGKNRQQNSVSDWDKYQAPERMVDEVTRQLAELHELDDTPAVQNAAFRDWGDDPFGGGWNSWNIGVDSTVVKEDIVKPIAECPLYICGEAYSDAQGWVEGALQTADMVLQKIKAPQS